MISGSFVTPFRLTLSWIADLFGAEVLHGSAIVVGGTGLLLSGRSGSGKSTTAIAAAVAGHSFLADDCVLLHDGSMHAVFSRAKVDYSSDALIGGHGLRLNEVAGIADAKRYFSVGDLDARFVLSHRLEAILFPMIGPVPGSYQISPQRATAMLASDSFRETQGGTARNLLRLTRACREVPSHRILLGTHMKSNLELIARIATRDPNGDAPYPTGDGGGRVE